MVGRHRSHLRPHSHRREKERNPQEANINLSYFHGKDNVEANLDWEIRVEQQLKRSLLQNLMALTLIQRKTKVKES